MKTLTKSCLICDKIITKKPNRSLKDWSNRTKYCSIYCRAKAVSKSPLWKARQAERRGKKLSIEIRKKMSEAQSMERHSQWKGGKPKCIVCGKQLSAYGAKYCKVHRPITIATRKKRSIATKGEKSYLWQGGITPINRKIRASFKMKLWREAVMKRDNYTCVKCGQRGGNLNVDHIKQFAYYSKLRFRLSNGRTLCVKCHKETKTYSRKYDTKGRLNQTSW